MSPQRFEHLLSLVGPLITKENTRLRGAITAAEWLTLTLRYLASGDAQQSQTFNFRIGKSTVSGIIRETCDAIWNVLHGVYLKTPSTPREWKKISQDFNDLWNFPHCLGAGDGKHVVIECPKKSGSNYFNYKGTFSIVLLAYGDANYCFTAVDVGQYGKSNDSGAFANSKISKAFETNRWRRIEQVRQLFAYSWPEALSSKNKTFAWTLQRLFRLCILFVCGLCWIANGHLPHHLWREGSANPCTDRQSRPRWRIQEMVFAHHPRMPSKENSLLELVSRATFLDIGCYKNRQYGPVPSPMPRSKILNDVGWRRPINFT